MKRIIFLISIIWFAFSCSEKYEYNTEFSMPVTLSSPESIVIDVASTDAVVLEWSGGGAADGSIVQYEVLFASESGNFENPIYKLPSDLGALPKLTLSHAQLNMIARKAGINAMQTGKIRWTVTGSKAGVVKTTELERSIRITRGEGIDNLPETLYLLGSGAQGAGETGGRAFRSVDDGVFHIYTNLAAGAISFGSSASAGSGFHYYSNNGKLTEGDGSLNVSATTGNNPVRIKVDFNTLSVTIETISNVRCIWGATFNVIGAMDYIGDGIFKSNNCEIRFIDQSRPETNPPSWLSWTEERYYFIAAIDGADKCWGRNDNVSPERPTGSETVAFYELGEFTWNQWEHLWKMSGSLDLKQCDITIYTNKDNKMYHGFSNIRNISDGIEHTPETLYLFGPGSAGNSETEGRAFRKVAPGVFHIYTHLANGGIRFKSSTAMNQGYEYYYVNNKLKEGTGFMPVNATGNNPVRIIVDFNALTVTTEEISNLTAAWGHGQYAITNGAFSYQGGGVFKATGVEVPTFFYDWGWAEERYRFTLKIGGTDYIWGSAYDQNGDSGRPDANTPLSWFVVNEHLNSECSPWDWLWKMASKCEGSRFDMYIYTNENGMFYHKFSNFAPLN